MDESRMITEFLNGTLESGSEAEFFSQLSRDERLRSELKEHLALEDAIKAGKNYFYPPVDSTVQIFKSLNIPDEIFTGPVKSGFFSQIKNNLRDNAPVILSGAVSSAITAVILLLFMNVGNIFQQGAYDKSFIEESPEKAEFTVILSGGKAIPPESNIANTGSSDLAVRNIIKYIYLNSDSMPRSEALSPEDYLNRAEEPGQTVTVSDYPGIKRNIALISDDKKEKSRKPYLLKFLKAPHEKGITFEYRSSSYWHLPQADIHPSSYSKMNNKTLALFYRFSDKAHLGAEVRQETFYQRYEDERKFYAQKPNLTTFSGTVRWVERDWEFLSAAPFLQVNFGLNEAGPVGRAMGGFVIMPYKDLQFILGLEYSKLWFYHNTAGFETEKIGLNYGVLLNW